MLKIWNSIISSVVIVAFASCTPSPEVVEIDKPKEEPVGEQRIVVSIMDYPAVPDLSSNPYEDAFATARVMPRESFDVAISDDPFILLFRVLNDRRRLAAADFQPGDLLSVTLTPQDEASSGMKSIQILETYYDLELSSYYAGRPKLLSRPFDTTRATAEKAAPIPPLEVIPSDSAIRHQRIKGDEGKRARIAQALSVIDGHLAEEGGSWEAWQESLKGFRADLHATAKHTSHIDHRVRKTMELESYSEPVPGGIPAFEAVRQLADQVEARGIDFTLLSVPSRIEIYPEWFSDEPEIARRHVGATRLKYLHRLLEQGIEVIDAGEILRTAKLTQGAEKLFWKGPEFHVSPQGYEEIATALKPRIQEVMKEAGVSPFSAEQLTVSKEMVALHHTPEFRMEARRVLYGPDLHPIDPNPESPIFFKGDSNLLWWQRNMYGNCGLISQLTYELNHLVDWKARANMRPHHAEDVESDRLVNKKLWIQVQTAWLLWDEDAPYRNVELSD